MKIESIEFVGSRIEAMPKGRGALPEIALSGRSNVGKSSLLNRLMGRSGLAKVSATPGKTQSLNYFLVNQRFHLVDLPGYGFAKAPAAARNRWSDMMQRYLRNCPQIAGCIQLVDVRHPPSREDREMIQWLRDERLPFCLVATKADKIAPTKVPAAVNAIANELRLPASQARIAWSSETGDGRPALLAWIDATLEGFVNEGAER